MREDIFGGLRNALDRGFSLDQAIQSFVNSGYPLQEVQEAAQALTSPSSLHHSQIVQPQTQAQRALIPINTRPLQTSQTPQTMQNPQSTLPLNISKNTSQQLPTSFEIRRRNPSLFSWTIILLIIILLLSMGSFIATLLYREQISSYIGTLIG